MVLAVDPRALDSCDGTGFRVERCVRGSGAPGGAVVRCGMASAWDTPTEGGGKSAATVAAVKAVNPWGGEDVMGLVGAARGEKIILFSFEMIDVQELDKFSKVPFFFFKDLSELECLPSCLCLSFLSATAIRPD